MNVMEIEQRLKVTEKALNEALKEIERLKKEKLNTKQTMKDKIDREIFDVLFGFDCDRKTGKPCTADEYRKSGNFRNLYTNVLMDLGYVYSCRNTKDNLYYLKALSFKDIPESDFLKLCDLIRDITKLMYEFKTGKDNKNESV